jgi:hypothetical protein
MLFIKIALSYPSFPVKARYRTINFVAAIFKENDIITKRLDFDAELCSNKAKDHNLD